VFSDLFLKQSSYSGGALQRRLPSSLQKQSSSFSESSHESTFVFPSQKQPSIVYNGSVGVVGDVIGSSAPSSVGDDLVGVELIRACRMLGSSQIKLPSSLQKHFLSFSESSHESTFVLSSQKHSVDSSSSIGDALDTAIPTGGSLIDSLHIELPSSLQKHFSSSSESSHESTFVLSSQKQPSIEYNVGAGSVGDTIGSSPSSSVEDDLVGAEIVGTGNNGSLIDSASSQTKLPSSLQKHFASSLSHVKTFVLTPHEHPVPCDTCTCTCTGILDEMGADPRREFC